MNSRRIFSLLMSIIMVMSVVFMPTNVFAKDKENEKSYLVGFKTSSGKQKYIKQKKVEKELKKGKSLKVKLSESEVASLKKDKNIAYIEEDFPIEIEGIITAGNDEVDILDLIEYQYIPYGIEIIGGNYTLESNFKGNGIKVAVFDTGISAHEDLNIVDGVSFVESEDTYDDLNGHGTHIAGIISAEDNEIGVAGIAPDVSLYAVKVLDEFGTGNYSNVIEGIYWAIDNDIDIINMSLGGTGNSKALQEAIQTAISSGIIIVAAAGNNGSDEGEITYPAKYPEVIAVGAIDKNYNLANFSSHGSELNIVAPGVDIVSTYYDDGYSYMSGTSMAAPHVAGVLAILEESTNLSNDEIIDLMYESATNLGDSIFYGHGVVNVAKATGIIDGPVKEIIPDDSVNTNLNDIDFDLYETDIRLKNYKNKLMAYANIMLEKGEENISEEIFEALNEIVRKDYGLHILPEDIKYSPKEESEILEHEVQVKEYYKEKYDEFENIEKEYLDAIDYYSQYIPEIEYPTLENEIEVIEQYQFAHPEELSDENTEKPNLRAKASGGKLDENNRDLELEQLYEQSQSNIEAQAEPSITIDSMTSTSVTFTVTFPTSGRWGNVMALDDHNVAQPYLYNNVSPKNGYYMTNGTYTYSGLTPGGFYYLHMMWSTDGEYYGYENAYYKGFQLPYSDDENLVRTDGTYVYVNMESADKSLATTSNFSTWLNRLDQSYLALQELTGNTPYNGGKIGIESERDLDEDWLDEYNYWEVTYAWSGNPVTFYQPFLKSTMRRLSSGDWSNVAIHELSHDFDKDTWEFDAEVLADFKTYYVVETLGAKVYPVDAEKYYTGSAFANYFKNDHYLDSYSNNFSYGYYTSKGLVWLLINIKNTIGWQPFIDTFHYLNDLPETNRSHIDTFNLFMTKLKEYSDYDVLSKLTSNDKAVIGDAFNGTVQYLQPVSSTNIYLNTPIDISSGNSRVYKFTPSATGTYIIETSKYAGTGENFDTVLELYADASLIETITSDDDGGDSLFSRLEVNLEAGVSYYIKVRAYSSSKDLYARITIKDSIPEIMLNTPKDVDLAVGEYIVYAFTPSTTTSYEIYTGPYAGTGSSNDTYLELYSDSELTNRIAFNDDGGGSYFSSITANLSKDSTYYIKLRPYSSTTGKVHARLQVIVSIPAPTVSILSPSNGSTVNVGNTVVIQTTGQNNHHVALSINGIWVVPTQLGNSIVYEYTPMTVGTVTITVSGRNTANSTDAGTKSASASIAIEVVGGVVPATLNFSPVGGGSYIYDNNPEFIYSDNLADSDKGNTWLLEQQNVTGRNVIFMTHSIPEQSNLFYNNVKYDIFIYNPSTEDATIIVEALGGQVSNDDATAWGGWRAFADYLGININTSDIIGNNRNSYYAGYTHHELPVNYRNNKEVTIEGGSGMWLFGDSGWEISSITGGSDERFAPPENISGSWQPVSAIARINVISGNLTVCTGAYLDKSKVLSPSGGTYEYTDVSGDEGRGAKYKGRANTLPEVVADLHWVIDDTVTAEGEYNQQVRFTDINGEEYLRRTLPVEIINRYYDNNIQYMWMTNISPTNDENGKLYSSETDMLGFTYKDHETGVEWVFDVDNDDGRGKPCNLGNWGVTNTYNITVTNNGEADRKLSFVTRGTGGGGGIFVYDLNDGTGQKVKWKSEYVGMESVTEPGVLSDDVSDSEIKSYEFYSNYYKDLLDIEVLETEPTITNKAKAAVEVCEFTVPAKNTKNIQIKFVFPNAYLTAFKNFMVVKE